MQSTNESERLDVVNDDIKLFQKTSGLTFGTDALLLASFIDERQTARAMELGGGSGIISFLLLARKKAAHVTVAELQSTYAALIRRNAEMNGMTARLTVLEGDIRALSPADDDGTYQYVFTNPPYMKADGIINHSPEKAAARHELHGDIFDFCRIASLKLKYGGHFYAVYRPDRLADLFSAMRENKIEPKKLTFVHADVQSPPSLILVKGKKGGGAALVCTPPLFLHKDSTHRENSAEHDYILTYGNFPKKSDKEKGDLL